MSRWHREGCRNPSVEVSRSIPSCKSCGGRFSLAATIALQELAAGAESCLDVPADEPYGKMNLWWPPSVQYTTTAQDTQLDSTVTGEDKEKPVLRIETHVPRSAIRAEVYGETLPEGSFRLACLYAAQDPLDPIHLDLETYRHSHAPDYETASYMWGGEAGDSAPRCPVFIGEYWDVFLQTKNCCELIRFARPTRGVRLLWVDAVCINQESVAERDLQVAMMHQIYSGCMQCLVYLGPDIVQWHGTQLPGRRGLHELERTSLERLLKERRYFSRLWVIQEVILSPRIIIPIADTVYWADNTTTARGQDSSSTTWDWNATHVPWLRDISQKRLSIQTACESLLSTRHTYCTDPRDRLFGVLGLVTAKTGLDAPLQPNYALSNQHIWLGFFAYSLVKDAAIWLLYNAAGHTAPASAPSWAPSWDQAATWSNLFCPGLNTDEVAHKIYESGLSHHDQTDVSKDLFWDTRCGAHYITSEASGIQQDISVDARTGALLGVRAMLLFTFLAKPTVVKRLGDFTIFRSHSATNTSVRIACREPLDQIIQTCTDHLFMLKIDSSIVFLVLRDIGPIPLVKTYGNQPGRYVTVTQPSRYRLVAACPALFSEYFTTSRKGGLRAKSAEHSLRGDKLQYTLDEIRKDLNKTLDNLVILVPFVYDRWELLNLFCSGYDARDSDKNDPEKLWLGYLACLPHNCVRVNTESRTHLVLRFEDDSNLMTARLNGWLNYAFDIWCREFATEPLYPIWVGPAVHPYIDWEWSLCGEEWQSFANFRCETFYEHLSVYEAGIWDHERRRCPTWDFHEIPRLEIGQHTGQIYLRAPMDAISKSYIHMQSFGPWKLNQNIQEVKDVLEIMSINELRNVLLDTSKDWSSFKYQEFHPDDKQWRWAFHGQTWIINIT